MSKRTPLYTYHYAHAKLTEFAGYEMPLWYTSTTEEHMAVRTRSGIFDVSHMGRVLVKGEGSMSFLEKVLPTDVKVHRPGGAFYTLLLNDRAGIIDDLIVVRQAESEYLLIVNAANREVDLRHLNTFIPARGVTVEDITDTTAMIAVQGPESLKALQPLTDASLGGLKRFQSISTRVLGQPSLVSRTGYTGENGYEVTVESTAAMGVWERLSSASVACGLGARDSLRLEAGLPLHGHDISDSTDPFQAGLSWVLSQDKKDYVGWDALSKPDAHSPSVVRRGIVLEAGIPREGFEVVGDSGALGRVTSGTFSPVLHKGIALCMARADATPISSRVQVMVRGSPQTAEVVRPPFYDETIYGWKRTRQQ